MDLVISTLGDDTHYKTDGHLFATSGHSFCMVARLGMSILLQCHFFD